MTTKTTAALSSRAVIAMMAMAIEGLSKASWVFKVAHFNPNSDQKTEEYILGSMVPQFTQWIGPRNVSRLDAASLEITNTKYSTTVRDAVDNWRFDKTGMRQRVVSSFGQRSITHWASLVCGLLASGTSLKTYDNQNFFSASHSWGDSGTLSNLLTNSDYGSLDVNVAAAPTQYEMSLALFDIIYHFMTFKDDTGEPMHEDASGFVVVAPVHIAKVVQAVITKDTVNTGSGVEDNTLKDAGFTIEAVGTPRLTGNVMYVFRADGGGVPPVILQEKQPGVELTAKAEGSDFEHDHDMWEFGAKANRAGGLFGWPNCIKATFN